MRSPAGASFLFIPYFLSRRPSLPSPAVMKLNLCSELVSRTSLNTSSGSNTLVISKGLDSCHAHINFYRSSICDCPSVALALTLSSVFLFSMHKRNACTSLCWCLQQLQSSVPTYTFFTLSFLQVFLSSWANFLLRH